MPGSTSAKIGRIGKALRKKKSSGKPPKKRAAARKAFEKGFVIKAARFFEHDGPGSPWSVAVYLFHDPDKYPWDYDMWLEPRDWRKLTGLRSPKKNETMTVRAMFEVAE